MRVCFVSVARYYGVTVRTLHRVFACEILSCVGSHSCRLIVRSSRRTPSNIRPFSRHVRYVCVGNRCPPFWVTSRTFHRVFSCETGHSRRRTFAPVGSARFAWNTIEHSTAFPPRSLRVCFVTVARHFGVTSRTIDRVFSCKFGHSSRYQRWTRRIGNVSPWCSSEMN